MEAVNEIAYKIANVPTRTVALFPNRAQVLREINAIKLKVGVQPPFSMLLLIPLARHQ